MATVTAFVRTSVKTKAKSNVRFRLTDGRGIILHYVSNITVDPSLWDEKNQKIKARILYIEKERIKFDSSIADMKKLILEIYANTKKKNLTSKWLKEAIDKKLHPEDDEIDTVRKLSFFEVFDEYLVKRKASDSQIAHNRVLKRMLQRFELYNRAKGKKGFRLELDTFTAYTIAEFEQFIYDEHDLYYKFPSIYKDIPERRRPSERGQNTVSGWLTALRTFLLWCIKNDMSNNNPFSKYSISECVYGTPIYISIEEMNQIYIHDFSGKPELDLSRDTFILQCQIGCRVGDLLRMTKANVIDDCIEYIARKTKEGHPETITVPLNDKAKEIIAKYSHIKDDRLIPFPYDQKYNRDLKVVFKEAQITRTVTWLNPTTRDEEKRPINELASSHMARRTFAGNLFKKHKDTNLVCALTGHVPGSKAFARYRTVDINMKREVMKALG